MNRDIVIRMDLDDGKFRSKLTVSAKELRKLRGAVDAASESIDLAGRRNRGWGRTMRDSIIILGGAEHALRTLNTLFLGLPRSILSANAEIEKSTALMRGLSTSTDDYATVSKAAEKDVADLYNMVGRTPFAVEAVTDSLVKLKAAGIDAMAGPLQSMVDSVAKFGGTSEQLKRASIAVQQMAGKGVISMEELRQQLGEAVPDAVAMMARSLNLSIGDMVDRISKGTVEASSALKAMFRQMALENSGSAYLMSQTWDGTVNRLKTRWTLLQKEIGDAGFFDAAKEQLTALTDGFMDSVEAINAARAVGQVLTSVVNSMRSLVDTIVEYSDAIWLLVKAYVAYKAALIAVIAWEKAYPVVMTASARAIGLYNEYLEAKAILQKQEHSRLMASAAMRGVYNDKTEAETAAIARNTTALRVNSAARGMAMSAMATGIRSAGSALMGFVGGPVGVAVVAVWGLYEAYKFLTREGQKFKDLVDKTQSASLISDKDIEMMDKYIQKLKEKVAEDKRTAEHFGRAGMGRQGAEYKLLQAQIEKNQKLIDEGEAKANEARKASAKRAVDASLKETMDGITESMGKIQSTYKVQLEEFRTKIYEDTTKSEAEGNAAVAAENRRLAEIRVKDAAALYKESLSKQRAALKKATEESEKVKIVQQIEALENSKKEQMRLIKEEGGLVILDKKGGVAARSPLDKYIDSIAGKVGKLTGKLKEANPYLSEFRARLADDQYGNLTKEEIGKVEGRLEELYKVEQAYRAEQKAKSGVADVTEKLNSLQGTLNQRNAKAMQNNPWLKPIDGIIKNRAQLDAMVESMAKLRAETVASGDVSKETIDSLDQLIAKLKEANQGLEGGAAETILARMAEKSKDISRSLLTDRERAKALYGEEIANVNELRLALDGLGVSTTESQAILDQYSEAVTKRFARDTETPLEGLLRTWKDSSEQMRDVWSTAMNDFSTTLTDALVDGEMKFKDFAKSILKMILKIQMQKMIAGIAGNIFSGGTSAATASSYMPVPEAGNVMLSAMGNVVGPKGALKLRQYANGGIARSPQLSIFGEGDTPEAYVPLPDGRTIPVTMKGGRQTQVAPVVAVNVINQTSEKADAQQQGETRFDGEKYVIDVVMRNVQKPGAMRDTFKGLK